MIARWIVLIETGASERVWATRDRASGRVRWGGEPAQLGSLVASMRPEDRVSPADGDPNAGLANAAANALKELGLRIKSKAWKRSPATGQRGEVVY